MFNRERELGSDRRETVLVFLLLRTNLVSETIGLVREEQLIRVSYDALDIDTGSAMLYLWVYD